MARIAVWVAALIVTAAAWMLGGSSVRSPLTFSPAPAPASRLPSRLVAMASRSVDYEIYGKVQGVYFRACTVERARELGAVGWVRNTNRGTVEGTVQGPTETIETMKAWLSTEGSPYSRIDRADFSNERTVESLEFSSFEQRR